MNGGLPVSGIEGADVLDDGGSFPVGRRDHVGASPSLGFAGRTGDAGVGGDAAADGAVGIDGTSDAVNGGGAVGSAAGEVASAAVGEADAEGGAGDEGAAGDANMAEDIASRGGRATYENGGVPPSSVSGLVGDDLAGLQACLEAMLMAADQPQRSADLARVLGVDATVVESALLAMRDEYDGVGAGWTSAVRRDGDVDGTRMPGGPAAHAADGIVGEGQARGAHDEDGDDATTTDSTLGGEAGAERSGFPAGGHDGTVAAGMPRQRGFALRRSVQGWRFVSRSRFEPVVSAFVTDAQSARLSQAALETLAIIAYQQPMTRAQVAAIRGVNSDGVIRSLAVRGLVLEEGVDAESHAALLVTSVAFLDAMGLTALDELPSLAPFLPEAGALRDEVREGRLAAGR